MYEKGDSEEELKEVGEELEQKSVVRQFIVL